MSFIIREKLNKERRIMQNYWLMFGFGIGFLMLMIAQGLLLSKELFYFLEVVELVGIYFIIKNFTKKEMGEWKTKKKYG